MNRLNSRKRYGEIGRVLAKHGFQWLWTRWDLGKVLGEFDHGAAQRSEVSQPENLRLTLEELGTTFIKLGQTLSTRPDLLPPEYIAELSKLQDHVPRVPYPDIEATIREEFGKAPLEIFASFDEEPRAAGSVAQVHNATLPDGTAVVVKVRRPAIEQQIEQDLTILGQVARILAPNEALAKKFDIEGLVEEFATTLRNELDFTREGQNSERIAAQFTEDKTLHVPVVYWDYSTHHVLAMEDIRGIKIDDLDALDKAGIDRHVLAENCAKIALVQVLENGFFHADPHPGNFFVQADGTIALLDYGMVGRIGDRLRGTLLRLGMAISNHDAERIVDELMSLGAANASVERQPLVRDVESMLQSYEGLSLGQISAAKLVREVSATAQKNGLRLPSDLIVLARVVAMDEGMGAHLDPNFNFLDYAQPYFKQFWIKTSLRHATSGLKQGAIDMAEMAIDLPGQLKRIIGMIEHGEVAVKSRVEVPDPLVKKAQQAANRIAISILSAGMIIGLSVLTLVYRAPGSEGAVYLFLKALLVVGVVIGVWLITAFWKSAR